MNQGPFCISIYRSWYFGQSILELTADSLPVKTIRCLTLSIHTPSKIRA